jgi:hypothetical protein
LWEKNYECQARSERKSNKEKKTLNNMKECNKQGAREHKQCVRKNFSMNEKAKKTKQKIKFTRRVLTKQLKYICCEVQAMLGDFYFFLRTIESRYYNGFKNLTWFFFLFFIFIF